MFRLTMIRSAALLKLVEGQKIREELVMTTIILSLS